MHTLDVDSSKDLLSFKEEIQNASQTSSQRGFRSCAFPRSVMVKSTWLYFSMLTIPVGIKLTAFTKQA